MDSQTEKSEKQSTLKQPSDNVAGKIQKPDPEKKLFYWQAASRPFKKRDKQFWVKLLTIAGVFGFILFHSVWFAWIKIINSKKE